MDIYQDKYQETLGQVGNFWCSEENFPWQRTQDQQDCVQHAKLPWSSWISWSNCQGYQDDLISNEFCIFLTINKFDLIYMKFDSSYICELLFVCHHPMQEYHQQSLVLMWIVWKRINTTESTYEAFLIWTWTISDNVKWFRIVSFYLYVIIPCKSNINSLLYQCESCGNELIPPSQLMKYCEICVRVNKNWKLIALHAENVHGTNFFISQIMLWKCGSRTKSWYMIQTCNIQYTSVYSHILPYTAVYS